LELNKSRAEKNYFLREYSQWASSWPNPIVKANQIRAVVTDAVVYLNGLRMITKKNAPPVVE
jgi:hypothetical protein